MKANLPKRRLIPKWRPVDKTLQSLEVSSISPKTNRTLTVDRSAFDVAVFEWETNPTAGHFGDVLSFAIFPECSQKVRELADEALKKGISLSPAQRALAGLAAARSDEDCGTGLKLDGKLNPFAARLRDYRVLLRQNYANPLLLLDFAQLQLAGGNKRVAERALRTALGLMPNSVLVLRTYARFLVHIGKPSHAHALIARHPATASNPWLMASELALADVAEESSRFFGSAKRLILSRSLPDAHITELAGALASHQLESGAVRDARKFFSRATVAPNDNVAAQAVTDQQSLNVSLEVVGIQRAIASANEAHALSAALTGDSVAAAAAGLDWLCDEPFSSRPAQFLTGVYVFDDQWERAFDIASVGLRADPNDYSLLINLSYLYAVRNDFEQAAVIGRKAIQANREYAIPFIRSTFGMIAYAQGDIETGDRFYQESMDDFERTGRMDQRALCALFRARYAAAVNHARAGDFAKEALAMVKANPCPESIMLLNKMGRPSNASNDAVRLLEQYIYHPSTNILELVRGPTKVGASPIIWAKD